MKRLFKTLLAIVIVIAVIIISSVAIVSVRMSGQVKAFDKSGICRDEAIVSYIGRMVYKFLLGGYV